MNDTPEMEAFKDAYQKYGGKGKDVPEWKVLESAAIFRKHTGDQDGAIEAMVQAVSLMRAVPTLSKETAINLNYLADLYLTKNATEQAEEAIHEAVELSRPRFPCLLGDNLWILAKIQQQKGEYREALASAEEARHLYQQQGHSYGVAQTNELIEMIRSSQE